MDVNPRRFALNILLRDLPQILRLGSSVYGRQVLLSGMSFESKTSPLCILNPVS
ncbi:hypothetical protein TNCV_3164281 [Trichonephila clavipes]|nr:hypothetical protein TNCV_3164281 [Trichonephila clavipes]